MKIRKENIQKERANEEQRKKNKTNMLSVYIVLLHGFICFESVVVIVVAPSLVLSFFALSMDK